jgi:hypothetical protein
MSDTSPRNPTAAQQMLADALLRSVGGASAQLVVTSTSTDSAMFEMGLVATNLGSVIVSPVVMRKLRPTWQEGNQSKWELLISSSSVEEQVGALNLPSAQSLFAMTLSVIVAEQSYLIESIASNEAFGQIYLYRLLLREQRQQAV